MPIVKNLKASHAASPHLTVTKLLVRVPGTETEAQVQLFAWLMDHVKKVLLAR